ncbi:hypothetical protein T4E_8979 [Trichinella pseudospiralis]|uniref:Uncharacterized protein n=1 Tax=Trichinella pseudospiralis TaxID=6337 RepID=A0A0V0Y7J3_TRIPS|nr:hypothetical protein T4E_8979 [Trichinella pseudospiralis]KRY81549.1 hypothetical protein T4D_10304 [Trichinella pseudospiralis]
MIFNSNLETIDTSCVEGRFLDRRIDHCGDALLPETIRPEHAGSTQIKMVIYFAYLTHTGQAAHDADGVFSPADGSEMKKANSNGKATQRVQR